MDSVISCARQGALLVARTDLTTAIVTGPERTTWLNALVTCEVASLKPGGAVAGLVLNKKGRVLTEIFILAADDQLLLGLDTATSAALLEHFDRHLVMEDAEIKLSDEPLGWTLGVGSRAPVLAAGAERGFAAPLSWFGNPAAAWVAGAPGLSAAGDAEHIVSLSLAEFDQVRIDLGILRFGVEFTESTYPEEANLEVHAINFNKGCYLGQEVVVKMRSRGHPSRKVVRLTSAAAMPAGTPLTTVAGEQTGSILSSASSRVLPGQTVAFASVRMADSQPGSSLRAQGAECLVVQASGILA